MVTIISYERQVSKKMSIEYEVEGYTVTQFLLNSSFLELDHTMIIIVSYCEEKSKLLKAIGINKILISFI